MIHSSTQGGIWIQRNKFSEKTQDRSPHLCSIPLLLPIEDISHMAERTSRKRARSIGPSPRAGSAVSTSSRTTSCRPRSRSASHSHQRGLSSLPPLKRQRTGTLGVKFRFSLWVDSAEAKRLTQLSGDLTQALCSLKQFPVDFSLRCKRVVEALTAASPSEMGTVPF